MLKYIRNILVPKVAKKIRNNVYRKLLKEYCDALISLQDKSDDKAFKGGIYCRACKNVHGRCPDAVYGFTVAAKIFGDEKYFVVVMQVRRPTRVIRGRGEVDRMIKPDLIVLHNFIVSLLCQKCNKISQKLLLN